MITKRIDIYLYAFKYWLQGDSWEEAKDFARAIVYGFKKPSEGRNL